MRWHAEIIHFRKTQLGRLRVTSQERIAMPTQNAPLPLRESFKCSGDQLDAMLQFAQERGLEEQPFWSVVLEWGRVVTLARSLNLIRDDSAH